MIFSIGEKPGKGNYQCIACGEIAIMNNSLDVLPLCIRCNRHNKHIRHNETIYIKSN